MFKNSHNYYKSVPGQAAGLERSRENPEKLESPEKHANTCLNPEH